MIGTLAPAIFSAPSAPSRLAPTPSLHEGEAVGVVDAHLGAVARALESNPFAAAPLGRSQEVSAPRAVPVSTSGEKQELIARMLGRFTRPEQAAVVREALSVFSADNLRLAVDAGVKVNVLSLADMPRLSAGVEIQKHFVMGRDRLMSSLVDIVSRRTGRFPLPGENETSWVRNQIVENRMSVSWPGIDDDEGEESVDFTQPDEIYNVSSLAGLTAVEPNTGERAIFIPSHQPTRGAIIHEMAHALDTLKHPATSEESPSFLQRASEFLDGLLGGGSSQPSPAPGLTWASEQDTALVQHFHEYVDPTRAWPGREWSQYAAAGDVTEYLAEAVRVCADHPDRLRVADPQLFDFARQFTSRGEYPQAHFTVH